MTFDQAKQTILQLLRSRGGAKNSEMIAALGGDEALFAQVREELLFDDLAEDKKGVGLIYTGRAATPETPSAPTSPPISSSSARRSSSASRPHRVFLSYGRADAEALAFRLQADLEAHGHVVWLDKQQIRSGASWEEQIEDAIRSHEVFVSLLTPHAVRRPDGVCLDEISLARYSGCKIVPVMVIQCRPPLGIYRLDWVDFRDWQMPGRYEANLRRLLAAIEGDAQVEGTYARLFATLEPMDFGVEMARLTRDFTGRQWLFAELNAWLADPDSRVFLLTGDPGSGKSAVMAQLVQRDPRVAAYHFCVASLAHSLDPFRFARSIAAQLATQLPGYRAALEATDLGAAETDPGALFRRLVVDPLSAEQPDAPALIVVDALDEAAGYGGRTIAAVLAERLRDLPPSVRLVLSSRKSPALLDRFSAFQPRELDAARAENLADVAAYLAQRLAEPKLAQVLATAGVSAEATATALIERGAGNFLYVVQAADALATGQLDPRHPERFPAGLVGIYHEFFGRVYPNGAGFERVRPLLDVILAAREPLTVEQIGSFAGVDPFDAAGLLEPLAPFFPLREGRVQAYHKSVVDWLAGEVGRSREYRVNVTAGHRRLYEIYRKTPLPPAAEWRKPEDIAALLEAHYHAVKLQKLAWAAAILLEHALPDYLEQWGAQDLLIRLCHETFSSVPDGMPYADFLDSVGYDGLRKAKVNKLERARWYRQLGKCARYLGDYRRALACYEQSLSLSGTTSDRRELARLYRDSAFVLQRLGKHQEALARCKRGLELMQEASDRQDLIDKAALHMRAGVMLLDDAMSLGESLAHFERARAIYDELGMTALAFEAYENMGLVFGAQGRHEEALAVFTTVYEYYEKVNYKAGAAHTRLNLGKALYDLRRYDEARPWFEATRVWFETIGDKLGLLLSLYNLGDLAIVTGDAEAATDYLEQALSLATRTGNVVDRPDILYLLGKANLCLGRKEIARQRLEEAVLAARATDNQPTLDQAQQLLIDMEVSR